MGRLKYFIRQNRKSQSKLKTNKEFNQPFKLFINFIFRYFQIRPMKKSKNLKNAKNNQLPIQCEIPKIPEHGPGIWLVVPLLEKLPSSVRARIVKIAGQVMEKSNFYNIYRWTEEDEDSEEESENDSDEESDDDSDEESEEYVKDSLFGKWHINLFLFFPSFQ